MIMHLKHWLTLTNRTRQSIYEALEKELGLYCDDCPDWKPCRVGLFKFLSWDVDHCIGKQIAIANKNISEGTMRINHWE